jgi:drug/metabolite transporter (DMT)-like permease
MLGLRSLVDAFDRLPPGVRGATYMIASCAGFACMIALIRHTSKELHPFEIAFFRNLVGLLMMLPLVVRSGPGTLRTGRLSLHLLRAVLGFGSMLCWFWVVSVMPLAEAVALNFTAPLFATLFAMLILKEQVGPRRWAALVIGFVGVMVVLRPGEEAITLPALLAIVSAILVGGSTVSIKTLSGSETPNTIVLYMVLLMTPMSLVPALFVWETPSWNALFWMTLLGLAATFSHLSLARGFAISDASALMPYDFSRLIFVAILGYVFFGETPDVWTWVGGLVIAGSSIYVAHREARRARSAKAAAGATGAQGG